MIIYRCQHAQAVFNVHRAAVARWSFHSSYYHDSNYICTMYMYYNCIFIIVEYIW